ncbi:DUF2850 domain-containing protein [Vibrio sp. ZSDE26]|uniref:DUF2850 domain-containing protein n=1 Tax=Vibrio amylolyticus TaxID=2847292 RepID=A0A9X1XGD5_9VIBR|nr:DUF2850 domain-containing protein [Vibrio amylolyticus]MCK6262542.1 DUF2850 domain-containing protein [Vibrio amylolyticus]
MANVRKAPQAILKREPPKHNAKQIKRRKTKEVILTCVLIALSIVTIFTFTHLFKRIQFSLVDQQSVYGVWVEQNVAGYATRKIHIGPDGVSVSGRVVSTNYEFDGNILEYQTGELLYQYRMLNEQNTQMIQLSDSHYNPTYHLVEEYTERLR